MSPAETPSRSTYPFLRSWWWLALSAGIFALAIAEGLWATSFGTNPSEIGIDISLASERDPLLTAISLGIHYFLGPIGAVIIIAVVGAYLYFKQKNTARAAMFISVVTVGWLASASGKILVGRPRPPAEITHALILEGGHDSFPSGHTAFATSLAIATVLVLARTRKQRQWTALIAVLFIALVGFSRLYLGVHYPSDVIGSILITCTAILAWTVLWNKVIVRTSLSTRAHISHPTSISPQLEPVPEATFTANVLPVGSEQPLPLPNVVVMNTEAQRHSS